MSCNSMQTQGTQRMTEIMRNEMAMYLDEASKQRKVRAVILARDPAGKKFCGIIFVIPFSF